MSVKADRFSHTNTMPPVFKFRTLALKFKIKDLRNFIFRNPTGAGFACYVKKWNARALRSSNNQTVLEMIILDNIV